MARGGVLYRGANSVIEQTAGGTSGHVLTSNGTGADPTFQATGAGTGTVTNTGTLTDHGVIVGNGGVDVSALATGTAGQVLTSAGASADPAWATPSFVLIEQQTPTGTVVTFSSLGSYTHLEIRYSARGDQVSLSTNVNLTFNGDTGSNYDRQVMNAAATTVVGGEAIGGTSGAIATVAAASAASGNVGAGRILIPDYRGTAFNKMALNESGRVSANSSGGVNVTNFVVQWRSTAAITSMALTLASGNFVTGSKFTLYGLT
jgi:hypothetical protein